MKLIKKIIIRVDFIVKKLIAQRKYKSIAGRKSLYVEFLGSPGVGKSTIMKEILKDNKSFILGSDYIKYNTRLNLEEIEDYIFHLKTLENQVNLTLKIKYLSFHRKIKIIKRIYNLMCRDIVILKRNNGNIILDDESFIKNCTQAILDSFNNQENVLEFVNTFKNRIFICCTNSPEETLNRMLKRQKETNNIIYPLKDRTSEEMLSYFRRHHDNTEHFFSFIEKCGYNILRVNTSDEIEINKKKIVKFINKNLNSN